MSNSLGYDILGMDMGAYNVKTSVNDFICRSIYSENMKYNIGSKGVVEHNGNKYQIGVGKIDVEILKSKRNTLPLFLYALDKSTTMDKVKVVVGLPKYQLDEDAYVNEIKDRFIGKFTFKCDGKDREIEVLDCTIFPEGMGAYYTINKDLSDKDVIIIDIGGSTINILFFSNGEFIKAETLSFGSLNLLNDVRTEVLKIHGGRHSMDQVAKYMQRGRVGKTDDTMKYVSALAQKYIDELKTLIALEFSTEGQEIYLSGGGVEVFGDCLIENFGDVNLICDYLHANANGFKIIGEAIYNG